MEDKILMELEKISGEIGKYPDYVQGGGGNTSAKLDGRYMAVKASGYRLDQVRKDDGYVIVDFQMIREYFRSVDTNKNIDFEKEGTEVITSAILTDRNPKSLRPSIETGFHSFMNKYVIHTHSVYANILCCSKEGEDIAREIFGEDFSILWVPYCDPGFALTIDLNRAIEKFKKKRGHTPAVIFMENHGLIVTDQSSDECIDLHQRVNQAIIDGLKLKECYPDIKIRKLNDNLYESSTPYLKDAIREGILTQDMFSDIILYPDQLVYIGEENISFEGKEKISIDIDNEKILYATNYREALTIDETLTAYIYVVDKIRKLGFNIQTMLQEDISFILNMEGEKYRKSLLKDDS